MHEGIKHNAVASKCTASNVYYVRTHTYVYTVLYIIFFEY